MIFKIFGNVNLTSSTLERMFVKLATYHVQYWPYTFPDLSPVQDSSQYQPVRSPPPPTFHYALLCSTFAIVVIVAVVVIIRWCWTSLARCSTSAPWRAWPPQWRLRSLPDAMRPCSSPSRTATTQRGDVDDDDDDDGDDEVS